MSFVKLTNKVVLEHYKIGDYLVSYADRIFYRKTSETLSLLDILPTRFRNDFTVVSMDILYNIPPHTDSGIKCTINFYVKPGNYKTIFYDIKDENIINTFQVKNQTNGKVYDRDNLLETNSFCAKKDEIYLLDTTKIHSVISKTPSHRFALCVQTNKFCYEDVKKMLSEMGNI